MRPARRHLWPVPAHAERIRAGAGQAVPGRRRQLPDAASLDRTEEVDAPHGRDRARRSRASRCRAVPGLSIAGFANTSNAGIVFFALKDFDERKQELSAGAIAKALNQKFGSIRKRASRCSRRRRCRAWARWAASSCQVEDRAGRGYDALYEATQGVMAKAGQHPSWAACSRTTRSTCRRSTPTWIAIKAKQRRRAQRLCSRRCRSTSARCTSTTSIDSVVPTGVAQADAPFRARAEDIFRLKTRNEAGEMVPLGSIVQVSRELRPGSRDPLQRLSHRRHQRRAGARLFAPARPRPRWQRSSPRRCRNGMRVRMDRSHLSGDPGRQQRRSSCSRCACCSCSWCSPRSTKAGRCRWRSSLIVPMALLSAIIGVWLTGGDNNIFTQIALFVLVGLACKNAILIVEFAKDCELPGVKPYQAALEAARCGCGRS